MPTTEEPHQTTSTDLEIPKYLEGRQSKAAQDIPKPPPFQKPSEEDIAQSQKPLEVCTIAPTDSPVKQQLKTKDTKPVAIKEVQSPSAVSTENYTFEGAFEAPSNKKIAKTKRREQNRIVASPNPFDHLPLNSDDTPTVPTTQTGLPSSASTLEMGEHNPQAKENAPQKRSKNARKRERRKAVKTQNDEAEHKEERFLAEQREERYLAELDLVKKNLARAVQEKKQILKQAEQDKERLMKRVLEKDNFVKQAQDKSNITKLVQSNATVRHQVREVSVSRAYKDAHSMIYWALSPDVRKKLDDVWDGLELMKIRMYSPNSTEMLRTNGLAVTIHHRCLTLFSRKYKPSLVLPATFTDEGPVNVDLERLMPEFLTMFRIYVGSRLTQNLTRALFRPFVEAWICERGRDMSEEDALAELSCLGRLREEEILPGLLRMGLRKEDALAELSRLGVLDKGKGQENGLGGGSKKGEVVDFSLVGSKEEIVAQLSRLGMVEEEARAELSRLCLLKGIQGQGNGDRKGSHGGDGDVDSDVNDGERGVREDATKHVETNASRGTDRG